MWRSRRRVSQLDLASLAGVSPRHQSFVETGRSKPSREMVLHLAEQLDVPLRDRNEMLTAAGFAPLYRESALDAPELASVRQAIAVILANHEPCPAIVIDGAWNLIEANGGLDGFLGLIPPELLEPPMNVVRASLQMHGEHDRRCRRPGARLVLAATDLPPQRHHRRLRDRLHAASRQHRTHRFVNPTAPGFLGWTSSVQSRQPHD
jgi:transcriptional regulator with XRE-family HTH domain